MKGFKVTNASRTRLWGIAASSLKELKVKAAKKFELKDLKTAKLVLLDGTIVDEEAFFKTLPSQTVIVIANEHEELCTGADIIYNALRAVNVEYLRAGEFIKNFLEENIKEKLRILSEHLQKIDQREGKTKFSTKEDDAEWFKGLETSCKTKEDFLKRRCKERISGYFYKASSDLRKSCKNSLERSIVDDFLSKLRLKLSKDDYNGGYFDRRASIRLCDETGLFRCKGLWNKDRCLYTEKKQHEINPYRSREDRILFSTWNLDHRIEKSRTIIPCIMSALRSFLTEYNSFDFDYDFIYSLLFTTRNLRLVHIVCHDKGVHVTAVLRPEEIIVPAKPKNDFKVGQERSKVSVS